jgi:hypothetical protein
MQNLEGRDPWPLKDKVYMACIKWGNLNAMLGKAPLTIGHHVRKTKSSIKNAALVHKTLSFHARGPFAVGDPVGMGLAVDMLVKSLVAKGRLESHVQFSTLRWLRSTFTKNGNLHQGVWPKGLCFPMDWGESDPLCAPHNPNFSTTSCGE